MSVFLSNCAGWTRLGSFAAVTLGLDIHPAAACQGNALFHDWQLAWAKESLYIFLEH
jgi:hypothetical protein